MYLRKLHIRSAKLLRDLSLDFTQPDGTPRMWTVIIGENGTCKTSVLRAIAMAATGQVHLGALVDAPEQYLDKRHKDSVDVTAEFSLDARLREFREYPGFTSDRKPVGEVLVESSIHLDVDGTALTARSSYADANIAPDPPGVDPIADARADDRSLWFVAGYGTQRILPQRADLVPVLDRPSVDRLRPLFSPVELIGPSFANLFSTDRARIYEATLQAVFFSTTQLLPGFSELELRGQGPRFVQDGEFGKVRLPSTWLSHGYQSTIAWVADLVGQILLEADMDRPLAAAEMEGLVLVDEIDLYLHPAWQRVLIGALRQVFPRIQFVATTHSPLSLVGLRTDLDEIVVLQVDSSTGNVTAIDMKDGRAHEPDPRLMTGTEIYRTYFGINQLYPSIVGEQLRRYRYLAADPTRSEQDENALDELEAELEESGIEVQFPRALKDPG